MDRSTGYDRPCLTEAAVYVLQSSYFLATVHNTVVSRLLRLTLQLDLDRKDIDGQRDSSNRHRDPDLDRQMDLHVSGEHAAFARLKIPNRELSSMDSR
jgi:hypothetical protein